MLTNLKETALPHLHVPRSTAWSCWDAQAQQGAKGCTERTEGSEDLTFSPELLQTAPNFESLYCKHLTHKITELD